MNAFQFIFYLLLLTLTSACTGNSNQNESLENGASLDTLSYEMKTVDRIYPMQFQDEKDTTIIKIVYPFFDSKTDFGKRLNDTILDRTKLVRQDEEGNIINTNYRSIEEFADTLMHEYKTVLGDSPISIPWYDYSKVEVLNNTKNLLSIKYNIRIYLGGMHEDESVFYDNYDRKDNHIITIDEVFKDVKDKELLKIGDFYFKESRKIAQNKKLVDQGVFLAGWSDGNPTGGFYFNDNFTIDKNYLTFYYIEYEVASYSFGPTELKLPLEKLRPYLKNSFGF